MIRPISVGMKLAAHAALTAKMARADCGELEPALMTDPQRFAVEFLRLPIEAKWRRLAFELGGARA